MAGTIFGWFVATADTTEPDWLPLRFRVSLFVTHILAPLFVSGTRRPDKQTNKAAVKATIGSNLRRTFGVFIDVVLACYANAERKSDEEYYRVLITTTIASSIQCFQYPVVSIAVVKWDAENCKKAKVIAIGGRIVEEIRRSIAENANVSDANCPWPCKYGEGKSADSETQRSTSCAKG